MTLTNFISPETLQEVLDVFNYGEDKYAHNDWKKHSTNHHISHAYDHIHNYKIGDILDGETKRNQLAHAVCRLLFALNISIEGGE